MQYIIFNFLIFCSNNGQPRTRKAHRTAICLSAAVASAIFYCVSFETAVLNELVAQLVEQRPFKAWVLGSSPSELTTFIFSGLVSVDTASPGPSPTPSQVRGALLRLLHPGPRRCPIPVDSLESTALPRQWLPWGSISALDCTHAAMAAVLLRPQRIHRIHRCRSARRNVACQHRRAAQCHHGANIRQRIHRAYMKQQRPQQACRGGRHQAARTPRRSPPAPSLDAQTFR